MWPENVRLLSGRHFLLLKIFGGKDGNQVCSSAFECSKSKSSGMCLVGNLPPGSYLCISQSHTRSKLTVGKYREVQIVNSDQPFCLECLCKVWTVFPERCSSSRVRLSITQISFKKLGYEWYSSQV